METIYCLFVMSVTIALAAAHDLPKGLTPEMYCVGCEATVKEIGSVLQHHTSETLEKRLNNLLRRVCQEDYFKSYEYNSKKLVLACNHLVDKHRSDLVPMLLDYYGSKSRKGKSYLNIIHKVCNHDSFPCGVGKFEKEEHDTKKGKIVFNEETDEFEIFPGENVRMMKPVLETIQDPVRFNKRDEL